MATNRQILLVEDEPTDVTIFKRALKQRHIDYPLEVAPTGEAALALLKDKSPESTVILMDINMPRMSGLEVLKVLRSQETTKKHCVFMFSSSENKSDVNRAYALGISGYLVKSVYFDQTLAMAELIHQYMENNIFPPDMEPDSRH